MGRHFPKFARSRVGASVVTVPLNVREIEGASRNITVIVRTTSSLRRGVLSLTVMLSVRPGSIRDEEMDGTVQVHVTSILSIVHALLVSFRTGNV